MLKQELQQKLQQKLSPQQIQLMKLVQLPTVAFEQRVKEEMEENPALEDQPDYEEDDLFKDNSDELYNDEMAERDSIDDIEINVDEYLSDDEFPSYKSYTNNYSADDDEKSIPYAQGTTFYDHLKEQLHMFRLDEQDLALADFLIGNLDEDGYLRREVRSIVDDLAFNLNISTTEEHLTHLLEDYIQRLSPTGVGARDLKECLLLQLKRKTQTDEVELAYELINQSFDSFAKKHYKKLLKKFDIDEEELRNAIEEIEGLNPKPGKAFGGNTKIIEHIVPDFTIRIIEGELELTLNGRNAPQLHVSRQYAEMFDTYKKSENKNKEQKKAVLFVKQKLDAAKWFIEAIQQRQNTLMATMTAIMNYQKDYFLTGDDRDIRPMILKDIAEIVDMDISTISRVANSKYVNTPYGTFLIKELFSESMTNDDGEEVSTREIKKILSEIVENENKRKPLTDEKLAKKLKENGYSIARRTVAKYREQLSIPVARLRKEI
ncbi:RNA polymerase factor sigma-54 [Candidatus Ornithobacterium hominis]|uniref:RNA polymerase factor sigma-54 n=1 Tax=Candidatus Ornithobacterium hominis TaxID=2497989 RepID=A0A383U0V2_9FLAO|nr:RNA polymerase factor sigma-54 [Candidatus Ornithobacterium hominis]MCT7904243.1 RNA polymerase factor sigma-54 [Candidatus Ornithobacterium hominis]SZD72906.1 RNA polymerase factor sigma-54 [Candidatus Ornithobacterium hominis]SZD73079.1 RNA polymerase factor sigma-54 [Candidatus Ornithobacterium hominis]